MCKNLNFDAHLNKQNKFALINIDKHCLCNRYVCSFFQNSSHSDVADGGPIFTERLKSWTEKNEKEIILSQIISMYLEMLESTDRSKDHVRNITEELYTLKKSLSDGSKKMEDLKDLTKLRMSDLKVQRKAVNELFSVLQKLGDTSSSHKRKRSQFQRLCRC
uniref:Interferon gamma n=1 Tax=Zonotrichia albicollis TaxID=44394 RepID=A0A8D2MPL2_ZONAL